MQLRSVPDISLLFLDRAQVEALSPEASTLLSVIEAGLSAHGRREVVMPPKAHLHFDPLFSDHFDILSNYIGLDPQS